MKRIILFSVIILLLGACGMKQTPIDESKLAEEGSQQPPRIDHHGHHGHKGVHHGHHQTSALYDSTGDNELNLPSRLEPDQIEGDEVYYTITAQKGKTEIFDGVQTHTLGYNEFFLGPVIPLKKGQTAHFTLKNKLDEETTFHWHGLIIRGDVDGGPHDIIEPGEEREITFDVVQDQATLWFHPHPLGKTAKQVYEGLAGLIYIEGDLDEQYEYGVNDFPLIFQDRRFDEEYQLNYAYAYHPDGTMGKTMLVNGTVNPKLTVKRDKIRLRLLNGSNRRELTFKLSNGQSFHQIASDGGLLNEPVELTELHLTPTERAEIVVDFSEIQEESLNLVDEAGTVLLPFVIEGEKKESKDLTAVRNDIVLSEEEKSKAVTKEIVLFGHGHHVTINGKKFDPERIDLRQKQGETEVWEVYNKPDPMGGMIHPFHIHGTQFKVISFNGEEPPAPLQGYKDTIDLKPGDRAKLAVTFEKKGIYMYHCHILEHEENGMMGQVEVY